MSKSKLQIAYAEWLVARAAIAGCPDDMTDEAFGLLSDAEDEAQWKMLRSPAENYVDIRTRAGIVASIFSQEDDEGVQTGGLARLMLAALIREVKEYVAPIERREPTLSVVHSL